MCVCLICVCSAVCACRAAAVGAAKPGATAALVAEPALSAGQQQEKERPASSSERAEGCEQTPAQDHREEGRPGKTSSRQRLSRQLPAVAVVAAAADWEKKWLLERAEWLRTGAQRGVPLSAAADEVQQWSNDQISATAADGLSTRICRSLWSWRRRRRRRSWL